MRNLSILLFSYEHQKPRFALAISLFILYLLSGCQQSNKLEQIKDRGVLTVVTRNSPTTYYLDRNGPAGFEYELTKKFAEHLGVELEVQPKHNIESIFSALHKGAADIAAAGLTITEARKKNLLFSEPYQSIDQLLVYKRGKGIRKPKSFAQLIDRSITVIADSSHAELLREAKLEYPELSWHEAKDLESIDLLDMVADRKLDHTIVDSSEFTANQGIHANLRAAFKVGEPGQIAWATAKQNQNVELINEINNFFTAITENGYLKKLEERHFGHIRNIKRINSVTFRKAVNRTLPKHLPLIKEVANDYELDWRLLAAISYQESYWNPRAKSPTGVRGLMMLTMTTAKELGIKKRTDPEQSLRGGSRYYKKLLRDLPAEINYPDRVWFALAAYNMGRGHVLDIRNITKQLGDDPNRWLDVEKHLPLLRKRKWYEKTRHGYARGTEAQTYVQNIRHYYNMLSWMDFANERTPPPTDVSQLTPPQLNGSLLAL